jgi:hypothetical protein
MTDDNTFSLFKLHSSENYIEELLKIKRVVMRRKFRNAGPNAREVVE